MRYFTTDTHFGHPLVTVLRGFTTFDPDRAQYERVLAQQGRKAAEDWAKGVVLDDSRLNFRKAADTDAHDAAIVANINKVVGPDDELWILGDIGYRTSVNHLKDCLRQLACKHLHAVIGNHDDWWLDDKPARNLFESIEPNDTVELGGFDLQRPDVTEIVNLSHFPYREDLAYSWPDDVAKFHDKALPFDGRKLLYGHTHQLSPAGARPEALNVGLDAWNLQPVSHAQIIDWFCNLPDDDAGDDDRLRSPHLGMPSFPDSNGGNGIAN
ncbi:phosphoesterase [Bifidobacterium biavatii]|uniref:Phosphoesterase/phosphohydrolase n=1 Tax=Bifidobacterium biavatii DSM 23969 TaxID=1437608 RepID=A0A087A0B5_9BIFI|nr:phosphoesterase [Bifidobacterium biavatii]KFI52215.1 phosphoesterase/phosphohydrolase [Bifidobacterium biavatii DSM 23969]